MGRKHVLLFAALFALLFPLSAIARSQGVSILTARGFRVALTVELALTEPEYERGLMFRKSMPANHGMLFVFPSDIDVAFWMKNTLIPLDMIFLDEKGKILEIREKAVPQSLDLIRAKQPVRMVLEINGGRAKALRIAPGDTMRRLGPAIAAPVDSKFGQ